jgi:hypothetical protein
MSMKCVGGLKHKNQQRIQLWHQGHPLWGSIEQISGWSCMLMTTSHCSRRWIALYRYEVNLVCVWSGWEVPIISYSMSPVTVRTPLKILRPSPHPFGVMVWYGVAPLRPPTTYKSMSNTFYMYKVDLVWVWSGWEVLIISYSMSPVRTPLRILQLAHSLLEWWYSLVLWQYGCQPWLKAFKHFL